MKSFITLLLSCIVCIQSSSQNCPLNIDFEKGDFSSWDCSVGSTSQLNGVNLIKLNPSAPVAGRHQIIASDSLNAKDPYGNFPMLCPYGGKYSVKLGNDHTGAEAEGISYTFTVPAAVDTFTFTYFYAVVFQDPNHSPAEQPRFFVTAYDVLSGNLINCASYNYIASGGIPGFQVSKVASDVLYKSWSPVSIQFAGLANRKVRLEFKTADCTIGGHFGYAYLDVGEGCSNILATAPYCKETNSILLNAPYGFQTYTWYNEGYDTVLGNQQSLTLSPPPATAGTFHVDMIPYPGYGCRDSADAEVVPLPVPKMPQANDYSFCQYAFAGQIAATAERGNDLLWYNTDTGGISNDIAPYMSTVASGAFPYYVSQKALFGCESFRKKIMVNVNPTPNALFNVNAYSQCEKGNQFEFTNTSANLYQSKFSWTLGDGTASNDTGITHAYKNYGTFNVNLKIVNPPGCISQVNKIVTVVPKPIASFSFPAVLCEKQTPFALVDNSYVPGGISNINTWNWLIDGNKVNGPHPQVFTPGKPGDLPVKLVVITKENCPSDTVTAIPVVHYRPYADFNLNNGIFCDNEMLRFNNLSHLPTSALSEQIIKWDWMFDNNNGVNTEHPVLSFTPGHHALKLVVETNYGCRSLQADTSFEIHPKPAIKLTINDSCVFRPIHYQGVDLLNTVAAWRWDLGNGLFKGQSLITRQYQKEGYQPLTLIGETTFGCKDTILRPFTIYDNKAFAGRDTLVAIDQPVQLNAHGGNHNIYVWSPAIGLNNAGIEDPVATLNTDQLYHLDALTDKGCDSHSKIFIKRFKGPDLYIANAFTPDKDGLNDVLHVFPVGILSFESFSIYNRYGQQIFSTKDALKGWNGTFNNHDSEPGNYVAVAKAVDYKGNRMIKSLNVILIR